MTVFIAELHLQLSNEAHNPFDGKMSGCRHSRILEPASLSGLSVPHFRKAQAVLYQSLYQYSWLK